MKNKGYGLFTTIAMIVGVVIGSGIFFKSDNILVATGGNIGLGVIVFCIAAIAIIFGGLAMGELASRTTEPGGVIAYAEMCWDKRIACAFGWFMTFLYYPTLIAVVAYVAGIYLCMLFGINGSFELQILIGLIVIVSLFFINTISARLGGIFQSASTIIKLLPLAIIAFAGLVFGNVDGLSLSNMSEGINSSGWIAAIAPIAFSFDGWTVSTSIGHEVRNSKRNLPRALIISPILILIIYILYFVGISIYLGPETIMALEDEHVYLAARNIFGHFGSKILLTFVVISIIGTVNGLIIGMIRQPYSLAIRGMFPCKDKISKVDEKLYIPVNSAIVGFVISIFWLAIHYITTKLSMMGNSDISEISVAMSYLLYIILYVKVLKFGINKEIKSIFIGIITPILAIIGALIIVFGSMSNNLFWIFMIICFSILCSGFVFWKRQEKSN
ncbi:putative amino acid/polyamine transporter [Clostridium neonatale]|uniref:APC family permease n=1 Tax=Clostridium neonatale TaxID=137838 RepID=UPI00291C3750|nr:putative amino acid/polyamine transporter [Clostridium neonatale]